jgi:fructokinase
MIATTGEALVDLIEQKDGQFRACLGGSVCNFTLGLARQGIPTSYLNPLSNDRFGRRFRSMLLENGVVLGQQTASACPTSLAVVSLDENGVPTYAFHRQGVADRDVDAAALIAAFPEPMELLHTGGLALMPEDIETMLQTMQAATKRNALISVDANLRPVVAKDPHAYREAVMRALQHAHIVKLSDEDLAHLGMEGMLLTEVANTLFRASAIELVAITRGRDGAALFSRDRMAASATPRDLEIRDTVGAGDCFHAGLIAFLQRSGKLTSPSALALLEQHLLFDALRHAISAASLNIMRAGCDPATWEETARFGLTW